MQSCLGLLKRSAESIAAGTKTLLVIREMQSWKCICCEIVPHLPQSAADIASANLGEEGGMKEPVFIKA